MFDYFIYTYGPTLAITILCAIFGTLGHVAKTIYVNHTNDSTKRSVARVVVLVAGEHELLELVEKVDLALHEGP